MRVLRAADQQFIHQRVRHFSFYLRIRNSGKIFIRGNRPFVAFLKNRFDSVMFNQVMNNFCDFFLRLKRVVRILNVNDRFAGRSLRRSFNGAQGRWNRHKGVLLGQWPVLRWFDFTLYTRRFMRARRCLRKIGCKQTHAERERHGLEKKTGLFGGSSLYIYRKLVHSKSGMKR